jgi:hypothetical protein
LAVLLVTQLGDGELHLLLGGSTAERPLLTNRRIKSAMGGGGVLWDDDLLRGAG